MEELGTHIPAQPAWGGMSICVVRNAHAADEARVGRRLAGWPVGRPSRSGAWAGNDGAQLQCAGKRERSEGNKSILPSFHLSVLRYEKICASHGAATAVSRIPKTASI